MDLLENFRIHAVSVSVRVSVSNSTVSAVEWFIAPAFCFLSLRTIRCGLGARIPPREHVRPAYKSYQMGLYLDNLSLAIEDRHLLGAVILYFEPPILCLFSTGGVARIRGRGVHEISASKVTKLS